jgi:uncharacterized protein YeaO (DUF488 family)
MDPPSVEVRRIYDSPDPSSGHRVLVDRLWPRGVRKDGAPVDEWAKEVAPSPDLRRWYGHDPARFAEFARRYRAELRHPPAADALHRLADTAGSGALVLVTATRDVAHSGAQVLLDVLLEHGGGDAGGG